MRPSERLQQLQSSGTLLPEQSTENQKNIQGSYGSNNQTEKNCSRNYVQFPICDIGSNIVRINHFIKVIIAVIKDRIAQNITEKKHFVVNSNYVQLPRIT